MVKHWDLYKSEIHSLYITDGRALDDVRRILKGRHNFDASTRAYRMKLEEWEMKKNKVAASLRNKVRSSRSAKSATSIRSTTRAMSSAALSGPTQDANAASSLSGPTFQFQNQETWLPPLNVSSTQGQTINSLGLAMPGTFSDLSAAQSVDTARHIDFTFHQSLFEAILNDSEEDVLDLLSTGISVNIRDNTNNSPLHAAIMKENVPIVKSLLNYGANIDATGFRKRTPLHLAVSSKPLFKLLMKHQPTLSLQDDEGNTALHHLLNTKDWTADAEVRATISLLLSAGMDINIRNSHGESPLHRIVSDASLEWSHLGMVSEFLNHKPNVILPTKNGRTILDIFLENTESNILPPGGFYYAMINTVYQCLKEFLIAGADPNTIFNSKPLVVECLSKGVFPKGTECEKALIQLLQEADINVAGPDGNYPLHLSLARYNRRGRWDFAWYAITAALISRNADVNQANNAGASPLEIWLDTSLYHRSEVVEVALLLVEAGADTTKTTTTGKTPLDMLIYISDADRIRLTKAFLKADIKKPQQEDYNVHTRLKWVEVWGSACKQSLWHLAKGRLSELEYTPSRPRTAEFMECASLVIMEHLLERHQSRLKLWLSGKLDKDSVTENYEEYCAILKDCRGRKPDIDVSWYTFLLDVMDFK